MQDSITSFVNTIIFAVPVGFSIYSFTVGKFPTKGGIPRNYIVWGDRNVDTKMLSGNRARFLSVLFFLIFALFILAISNLNNLFGNIIFSNIVSIIIGVTIGMILCRKMISIK
jgi:hypothetical protein